MSNSLQLPKEAPWLDNLIKMLMEVLRLQWEAGCDTAVVAIRSDWILGLLHIRGWAHRTNPAPDVEVSEVRYRGLVLMLGTLLHRVPRAIKSAYWSWLENALLNSVKEEDREVYAASVEQVRSMVAEAARREASDGK